MVATFKSQSLFKVECDANDWLRANNVLVLGVVIEIHDGEFFFKIKYLDKKIPENKLPDLLQNTFSES